VLLGVLAALAVAAAGALAGREALRRYDALLERVRKSEDRLARSSALSQRLIVGASLRAAGYAPWFSAAPPASPPGCARVLFAAHIYPKNGVVEGDVAYPDPDAALASLLRAERLLRPERVVFGGDSIVRPSAEGVAFIAGLQKRLPHARFVLGNHENWWSAEAAPLRALLPERHGREDHGRVRLVWLHSVAKSGAYGLDDDETAFLRESLAGNDYDWAVLILHHALWAGESAYVNKEYEGAEALQQDWLTRVLPILEAGRVRLVVNGDSGWRRPGVLASVGGIPHATTGWSGWLKSIPPEWLVLELCPDGPIVERHIAFDGELLRRREWPATDLP
jgi:hypothetical protein